VSGLNFTANKLLSLTPKIGQLKKLEELILEDNCLTTLPYQICKLETLTKINLKNNPLTSLPRILKTRNVEIEFDEKQKPLLENESFWTDDEDDNPDENDDSCLSRCPSLSSCTIQ
jgi:Leucine-rich repeat (LRR) protein